jgi:hypothetical protein
MSILMLMFTLGVIVGVLAVPIGLAIYGWFALD